MNATTRTEVCRLRDALGGGFAERLSGIIDSKGGEAVTLYPEITTREAKVIIENLADPDARVWSQRREVALACCSMLLRNFTLPLKQSARILVTYRKNGGVYPQSA